MRKDNIPKCDMGAWGESDSVYWMGELGGLLLNYPFLEHEALWETYCLIYIEKGEGLITVDSLSIRIDEPKIILIKPAQITLFDISRKCKGVIICFKEDFFSLRYNNNILYTFSFMKQGTKPFQRLDKEQNEKANLLIGLMQEEFRRNSLHKTKILRSYLNIILFELQALYSKSNLGETTILVHEKIIEFEKLLNKYFASNHSPSYYAKALFVTENYLNKLCKQYKGKTLGNLIRERVVIEAQRLLHHTQLSVSQIALELGFESPSYFTTFFKKHLGVPPEAFRERYKN